MNKKIIPFSLLASFLFWVVFSQLASASSMRDAHTEVELISEVESLKPGGKFWIGVRFKMDPQWHVYWKNPGDSGLEPRIEWNLPEGFSAGDIQWPYPQKIEIKPLVSYGYEGEVLLMSDIQPPDVVIPAEAGIQNPERTIGSPTKTFGDDKNGNEVELKAQIKWLACKVDCIPGQGEVSLSLPVTRDVPKTAPKWRELFAETRERLPLKQTDWGIKVLNSAANFVIQLTPPSAGHHLKDLTFFPERSDLIQHAAAQKFLKIKSSYRLEVPKSLNLSGVPEKVRGVLVTDEGWRGASSEKAWEIDEAVENNPSSFLPQGNPSGVILRFAQDDASVLNHLSQLVRNGQALSSLTAFLFAFLGGLILNLMPCVFPVLSIKILNFVKQAQEDRKTLFAHGLIFSAGVILSFLILAGGLLLFRAAGQEVGWGFQLQSPVILVLLSLIFFIFALNLMGLFEIPFALPAWAGGLGTRKGLTGSFFSGVLATVVATPCTAPFMGSALGFALIQPAPVALGIFFALGLGMAAPYFLLCSFPGLAQFLPKPGPWMETLKKLLGIPLLATVVWLLWVLALQARNVAVVVSVLLLCVAFSLWIKSLRVGARRAVEPLRLGIKITIILFLIIGTLAGLFNRMKLQKVHSSNALRWESYSEERVEALLKEGKPVFVDFTAAWCLTCQVNERIALNAKSVVKKFQEKNVVPLKADWTSYDEKITRALAKFGRNSIPFYVFYPGGKKDPIILPELLTPKIVLEALEELE